MIEGIGLGLRLEHFDDILNLRPETPWFEVILEDFLTDGPHHEKLLKLRESYPIVFHSIGLNLGGVDPFDKKAFKINERALLQISTSMDFRSSVLVSLSK